jgi:hypothetical protein
MSETETTRSVQVLEREVLPFPAFEIATETQMVDPDPPVELPPIYEETFVPDDIEQRLIYYWLCYGPKEYAASICRLGQTYPAADPSTPPPDNVVEINPLHIRRPRTIGFHDDGVRREMIVRE